MTLYRTKAVILTDGTELTGDIYVGKEEHGVTVMTYGLLPGGQTTTVFYPWHRVDRIIP